MKRSRLTHLKFIGAAVGVLLGRGAMADTILTFDARPSGQANNTQIAQSFGDNVSSPGNGIAVSGFATPGVALTWSTGVGGGEWDYYVDSVWSAGQLDGSNVGTTHRVTFTPTATAGVSIKSFNFHPYYNNGLNYTYDWSVTDGATVLASGSIEVVCDGTKNHPVTINYAGSLGQALTLNITRTGGNDSSQNIAVDDIRFSQLPEPSGPFLTSLSPANGQNPARPDAPYDAAVTNAGTAVVPSSIKLFFNGATVNPTVTPLTGGATVSFRPSGLLPSESTNKYTLTYNDNAVPARSYTNDAQFVVVRYVDVQLTPPLYLETFDGVPEGDVPAGWTRLNYTPGLDSSVDLNNLNSASYTDWVVVNSDRFKGPLTIYSMGTSDDYQRVLSFNMANVENGRVVESLAQSNILFGDSGYRTTASQVLYIFTRDYNLTGRTNVFVSYHSLWEQNQDSIGAVEYSIDQGQTWLPIVYMLDSPDVVLDAFDNVDAVATFTSNRTDIATYIDPVLLQTEGGNYGAFIGAPISQALAPYVSARIDDDPIESKRVELFRLPAADNQATVRFRFAHAGSDSWYFGIDNFGIYSLPTVPVSITRQPRSLTRISANSAAVFSVEVSGTPPFSYQWRSNGVDIAGATNARLIIPNLQPSQNATYSVRVSNAGGSLVSSGAVVSVFSPRVTGQWDFDQDDLRSTLVGVPMEYRGDTATITTFADFLFPVEFENAHALCFTNTEITQGYILRHGAQPNGGGTKVNQYTLIMDLMYPSASSDHWRALWQTDPQNSNGDDADLYINPTNGVGSAQYDGTLNGDTWYRVAFVVDLAAPTTQRLGKYINGVKVGSEALDGVDSRLSLLPSALLFTTGDRTDVFTQLGYVNSIQFVEGRLSDADLAALGGPNPTGTPLLQLRATPAGANLTLRWKSATNIFLQKSASLTNPNWQDVPGTFGADSFTETVTSSPKFYRLAIQ